MPSPLRIAQVAPPLERVPPLAYGGTERVVFELVNELTRRGHDVTTFASADSEVPGRLISTVDRALRPAGFSGDPGPYFIRTELEVLARADEFDIIHSHLEWGSILLTRALSTPVVATFHGRIDTDFSTDLFRYATPTMVAISDSQARTHPEVPWAAVIHHGLSLSDSPFDRRRGDDLCFVGRVAPEKGIVEAIEIAKLTDRHLRIAAKIGTLPEERAYHENVFMPAVSNAGSAVEFLGEVSPTDRDRLFAESYATLMPGAWPEPFGLVTIESLACGTPIVARRIGALPEIIREGRDGFFGDDVVQMAFHVPRVASLDRMEIRRSALFRFSPARMTDDYEAVYRRVLAGETGRELPRELVREVSGARDASAEHMGRAHEVAEAPGDEDDSVASFARVARPDFGVSFGRPGRGSGATDWVNRSRSRSATGPQPVRHDGSGTEQTPG